MSTIGGARLGHVAVVEHPHGRALAAHRVPHSGSRDQSRAVQLPLSSLARPPCVAAGRATSCEGSPATDDPSDTPRSAPRAPAPALWAPARAPGSWGSRTAPVIREAHGEGERPLIAA